MAVRNQVPVVPCVFTFREPAGIRKIFKRKKDVTLKILKPVYSDSDKYIRQQMEELKEKVAFEMKETITKKRSFIEMREKFIKIIENFIEISERFCRLKKLHIFYWKYCF